MKNKNLAKLAIAGIAGATVFTMQASTFSADNSFIVQADKGDMAHKCSGLNECKGLGGCKVTKEQLAKLAKKRGISVKEAGKAHQCAGLNECKGLGGCKVTKEKLKELKKKRMKK